MTSYQYLSRIGLPSAGPNHGVVVNMANIHWVAFRVHSGRIWHLDSCLEPRIVTYSEYLNFLAKYESRAYAVETIN